MNSKDIKIRSLAVVLSLTAPLALSESSQPTGGLSPSAAADLLFQLETLQQEVQHLRGQLEQQGHELKLMKQSQRDRYIDLDKRISLLMSASAKKDAVPVTYSSQPVLSSPVQSSQQVVEPIAPSSDQSANLPATPLAPVSLRVPSVAAKEAYSQAYNLIHQRDFAQAEQAFGQFVVAYPSNTLTGNGYYWLGEVKLVQGKSEEALESFNTVIQKFPGHGKEKDALYKLGTVNDQLGNTEQAKAYLQDVIQRFPNSKTAKLAAGYLSNLK
ncbi:tol-pal system protein YbgF [Marinomonas posidonica]|uniref:Cell division coordinator CpoB n=1 Tax=Marinomonas posidonica (strain CECT 7376 / NCIMB 14433 / IVIA-Po-181) TaxID=491952 RepID=F6D0K0_MARPP|nr:tol-pal system protein YbgF [Marinomonas posidonica]AEF54798.1 tol-pal system protein YbgF [Marinomonas posidonica IVIA-Po-181]